MVEVPALGSGADTVPMTLAIVISFAMPMLVLFYMFKSQKPKLTLHYLPLRARAEPLKMILRHCKIDFVDREVTFAEWGEWKASGKVPPGRQRKDPDPKEVV